MGAGGEGAPALPVLTLGSVTCRRLPWARDLTRPQLEDLTAQIGEAMPGTRMTVIPCEDGDRLRMAMPDGTVEGAAADVLELLAEWMAQAGALS